MSRVRTRDDTERFAGLLGRLPSALVRLQALRWTRCASRRKHPLCSCSQFVDAALGVPLTTLAFLLTHIRGLGHRGRVVISDEP